MEKTAAQNIDRGVTNPIRFEDAVVSKLIVGANAIVAASLDEDPCDLRKSILDSLARHGCIIKNDAQVSRETMTRPGRTRGRVNHR